MMSVVQAAHLPTALRCGPSRCDLCLESIGGSFIGAFVEVAVDVEDGPY